MTAQKNGSTSDGSIPNFNDLVKLHYSHSEIGHAYETLKNNTLLHLQGASKFILLVTSAQPLEGKTTIAINLAISMMLARKKTLIVDTDLRRPQLHKLFPLENKRGFTDILLGAKDPSPFIQDILSGEPNDSQGYQLNVLTSGKVTQSALKMFGTETLKSAFDQFLEKFDVVILDAPPVLAVSDTLLLAPLSQGILLVLNSGVVTEEQALTAKNRLQKSGGKILGAVMNRFDEKVHGAGFNSYFQYYGSRTETSS